MFYSKSNPLLNNSFVSNIFFLFSPLTLLPNNDQCHYSEASAPRTDPGDSGAADSSDQASVAGPGQDLVTSDQSSISTSEAAGAADTAESGDSPDQSDTAVQ